MAGTHFSGRTLARSEALQLLFQAEATGRLVSEVLEGDTALDDDLIERYTKELIARDLLPDQVTARLREADEYARELALGCDAMRHELDAVLGANSSNWSVDRMSAVDRNLLRMALFEMLEQDGVDTAVAIDECVELAKAYGTDESSRFVNGLLGKIARKIEAGEDVLETARERLAAAEEAEAAELLAEVDSYTQDADERSDEETEDLPEWAQE